MSETELKKTQVDLAGLMEVLGKNLYSTPTVAIRELVQNAHDSCVRRKLESSEPFEPAIFVRADHASGVLAIEDRGAGLTKEEIERFLATVGAGYTKRLRAEHADAGLIGFFGLGFLSAFIVSDRIDVYTTSYKEPGQGWHFSSRSGESYTIRPTAPRPIGTRVELLLSSQFRELANATTTRALLERYCALLAIPIHAEVSPERTLPPVNAEAPPWRRQGEPVSALRRKKLGLEFAKRFEPIFEPICTIDLAPPAEPASRERGATDPGSSHAAPAHAAPAHAAPAHAAPGRAGSSSGGGPSLAPSPGSAEPAPAEPEKRPSARGLLWIQDGATYGTSDNRNVSLFVRGMLVSQDERDLLPSYAGFVGAVIETDDLSPTASREDVQKDDAYLEIAIQVKEALIGGLCELARSEPAAWRRILTRHNEALLGASLCDERLFELLAAELKVPTSEGDLTVPQVVKRGQGKIHVSIGEKGGYEETLFRALMVPVITGTRYAALPFSTRYGERFGATVVRLGTKEGNDMLFQQEPVPPEDQRLLTELLGSEGVEVVPARFLPEYLPLVLMPDREVILKERIESDEADRRISSALLGMARLFTQKVEAEARAQLFVNLDAEPIKRLVAMKTPSPLRAQAAALLRSLSHLMSSRGDAAVEADLSRTLREYSAAIAGLLGVETRA